MMMAVITVFSIFFLAMFVTIGIFYISLKKKKRIFEKNIQIIEEDFDQKENLYRELNDLALGLIEKKALDTATKELEEAEEKLRAEKGRVTITQAELDAIETRLRELEEFERELEASMIQSTKEIEMLKRQEDDVKEQNAGFTEQLATTVEGLDKLLTVVGDNEQVTGTLTALKDFLSDLVERLEGEAAGVERINQEYLDLKKSYDALDIEYAQLYEKHNTTKAVGES